MWVSSGTSSCILNKGTHAFILHWAIPKSIISLKWNSNKVRKTKKCLEERMFGICSNMALEQPSCWQVRRQNSPCLPSHLAHWLISETCLSSPRLGIENRHWTWRWTSLREEYGETPNWKLDLKGLRRQQRKHHRSKNKLYSTVLQKHIGNLDGSMNKEWVDGYMEG